MPILITVILTLVVCALMSVVIWYVTKTRIGHYLQGHRLTIREKEWQCSCEKTWEKWQPSLPDGNPYTW